MNKALAGPAATNRSSPSDEEAVLATPRATDHNGANSLQAPPSTLVPMSPAWIKATIGGKDAVTGTGIDPGSLGRNKDLVLLNLPVGIKLADLDGKKVDLPATPNAEALIEYSKYEIVKGPDEGTADLHVLGVADGNVTAAPVAAMYSIRVPLPQVPEEEDPVDDLALDALIQAQKDETADQPMPGDNGYTKPKKKKKTSRHHSDTATVDPAVQPNVVEQEAHRAKLAPAGPSTAAETNQQPVSESKGGKKKKKKRSREQDAEMVAAEPVQEAVKKAQLVTQAVEKVAPIATPDQIAANKKSKKHKKSRLSQRS